jgi:hypothetical protein
MGLASTAPWQVRIAGMHATGGWDHFASRGTYLTEGYVSNRQWPLFHLFDTASDPGWTIEFLADCEKRGFLVRIRKPNGKATDYPLASALHYWYTDSPLFVTIALSTSTHAPSLIVGASMGGDEMRTLTISDPFDGQTTSFGDLRFHATAAESNEVVGFRWFGGDYDHSLIAQPTEPSVKASFSSLNFLE